jgi:hypothetical protein
MASQHVAMTILGKVPMMRGLLGRLATYDSLLQRAAMGRRLAWVASVLLE